MQYEIETRTEKRTVVWAHEPYTGQLIDSSDEALVPKPWDVLVAPPNPYKVFSENIHPSNFGKMNILNAPTNRYRKVRW